VAGAVLDDDQREPEVGREVGQQDAEGLEATPRAADDDEPVAAALRAHATLR
jgi:hypothetical protein